jgi:hypothetical protein
MGAGFDAQGVHAFCAADKPVRDLQIRHNTECLRGYKTKAKANDLFSNACHITCPRISRNLKRDLTIR